MVQPLSYFYETPSQTAGPYVHIGLIPQQAGFDIFENSFGSALVGPDTKGERIIVEGRVFDGTGTLVRDALLEIWQADSDGQYNHPASGQETMASDGFRGWGRTGTDFETGVYRFATIKPGAVVGRHGRMMAPHINLWIVARGINIGLNTRLYFSDETQANAEDPVLNLIEQKVRRQTLIAERSRRGDEVITQALARSGFR
jgi:protocatechuate 3,4-dioxygenase, alpha subunit